MSNQLLNSNLFIAATTLFVGFAAYFLYKKQKRDEKKDAATILLAEIRAATAILPGIIARFNESGKTRLESGTHLLPSESWSKYKYLFVNDLKSEEWRAVDSFYKACMDYDAALIESQSYFAQNTGQIWVNIHKNYREKLTEFFASRIEADELFIAEEKRGKIVTIDPITADHIAAFTDTYIANAGVLASYDPVKPVNEVAKALESINKDLLLSSVGRSLERISTSKVWWPFGRS